MKLPVPIGIETPRSAAMSIGPGRAIWNRTPSLGLPTPAEPSDSASMLVGSKSVVWRSTDGRIRRTSNRPSP